MKPAVTLGPSRMKTVGRMLCWAAVALLGFGAAFDLFGGLTFWRAARSRGSWAVGVLAFAAIYVIGETAVGWIDRRDGPTDPLWRRLLHLAMLVGLVGACILAAFGVWSAAT